jgi:hypothetical protein
MRAWAASVQLKAMAVASARHGVAWQSSLINNGGLKKSENNAAEMAKK